MNKLNVSVSGLAGAGKSTAARVICDALIKAGFLVSLTDKDDVPSDQMRPRLTALRGTEVLVSCIEPPDNIRRCRVCKKPLKPGTSPAVDHCGEDECMPF
jgi:ABC-type multidrug transport system ATPase subunit